MDWDVKGKRCERASQRWVEDCGRTCVAVGVCIDEATLVLRHPHGFLTSTGKYLRDVHTFLTSGAWVTLTNDVTF